MLALNARMKAPIFLLENSDIADAMRLSTAAGWNQTGRDWARMLAVAPHGCFGIRCEGTLAATATAVCYGTELAWIGMVLTLPEFRGRGLATRLMEHALQFVDRLGIAWTKLDATEMGSDLYRKLGFAEECAIERWEIDSAPRLAPTAMSHQMDYVMDRHAFGADRSAVLNQLALEHPPFSCAGGFALGRQGANAAHFGPCVAGSGDIAERLLHTFLSEYAGQRVFWDLLPSNPAAAGLARTSGFLPSRHLIRMARKGPRVSAPLIADHSRIFAAAGFELG